MGGQIDVTCPVEWSHPLNQAVVDWWGSPSSPGWSGGRTLRDLVRGGKKPNDGVINGGAICRPGGPTGLGYITLDGTDDYISVAGPIRSYASGSASLSMNLWVKMLAAGIFPAGISLGIGDFLFLSYGSSLSPPRFLAPGASCDAAVSLTLNRWFMVTCTADFFGGTGIKIYINGELSGSSSSGYAATNFTTPQFGRRDDGYYANAQLSDISYRFGPQKNGLLSPSEVRQLYDQSRRGHPDTLRRLSTRRHFLAERAGGGGGANYPLTADAGAFSLTGQTATLKRAASMPAAAGGVTLAGQPASLTVGRRLLADAGSYALTGQAATLLKGRTIPADPGTLAASGQDAGLRVARLLPSTAGSFALSGQAATLLKGRTLTVAAGSLALSGQAASLRAGRLLAAGAGAFALTGQAAALTHSGGTAAPRALAGRWAAPSRSSPWDSPARAATWEAGE
jgi:hypothetical protein